VRIWIYSAILLAVLAAIIYLRRNPGTGGSLFVTAPPPEVVPLCPWREPESDLTQLFPGASEHHTETKILSGHRLELTKALGRPPAPDEHALQVHRILQDKQPVGTILTRRLKGETGAIELVLAVKTNGHVAGLRIQRLREPELVAAALQSAEWLGAFIGKSAADDWHLGADIPPVPAEAKPSAQAIVENVRSLLILLEEAERVAPVSGTTHHAALRSS
jgi:hypothetical protein